MIQQAIKTVIEGRDLTRLEAYEVMSTIMNGEATPAQIAAFLVASKLKGEKYQEIAGMFAVLLAFKKLHLTNN